MAKDDGVYLRHILDAILKIEKYTKGVNHKKFMQKMLIQDAVIRQLEIIGEATKRVSPHLKQKYAAVSWRDVAGMRDKLIHAYFGVDLDAVWKTVAVDIPHLKREVTRITKSLENN